MTSLTREEASPEMLLAILRRHWQIENRLFYVRDVTFGEDHSQVRQGSLPHVMAAIRNVVIACLRGHGFKWIPAALRYCQARLVEVARFLGIEVEMLRTE